MKKIKTRVKEHYNVMKPYVIRDKGQVPPILFFQFDKIDPRVSQEMSVTTQNETIFVENGFFVPMAHEEVLRNKEVFLSSMATIMAILTDMGIAGNLKTVSIAICGTAMKLNKETQDVQAQSNVFLVSGISDKGESHSISKEIRMKVGVDTINYDLVDSTFLTDEIEANQLVSLSAVFDNYNFFLYNIKEDKESLKELDINYDTVKDDPVEFVVDLIDAATYASSLIK